MSTRSTGRAGFTEPNTTPLIDVLLVLLIIFLVMIPIMARMHTVEVPNSIDALPDRPPITIKLRADLTASIDDGESISAGELVQRLRARVVRGSVVFVDFEDGVPWSEVIATVDTVKSFADDANHESIKVAVRIRDPQPAGAP